MIVKLDFQELPKRVKAKEIPIGALARNVVSGALILRLPAHLLFFSSPNPQLAHIEGCTDLYIPLPPGTSVTLESEV